MPYYGPDVAAFTPTQNAAFDANIGAAQAFGLLDPNSNLTATSGMPTPTDFDGFSGYSSQPIYESALAELKANQPEAVAQYDALFGANVPTTRSTGQGGFRGSANVSSPTRRPQDTFTPDYDSDHFKSQAHKDQIDPYSYVNQSDMAYENTPTGTDYKSIVAGMNAQNDYEKAAGIGRFTPTPFSGNPHMGK